MSGSQGQPVVLVGFGGSGASVAALTWAAAEALRRGARLRVVQGWRPHPVRALYAGTPGRRAELTSPVVAADQLASTVRAVLSDVARLDIITEVIEGPPERVLAEASAGADLLVLGAGRQAPVAQIDPLIVDRPVGPVIRACLSHARCPVVVISPVTAAGLGGSRHGAAAGATRTA